MDQITLDAELAHGPVKNRKCTDILCLLIFLASAGFTVYLSGHAFTHGHPERLFRLADNSGNVCGQAGTPTEKFPYLYFMSWTQLNATVCVSECPDLNKTSTDPSRLVCYPNKLTSDCKNRKDVNKDIRIYDSAVFANKTCLPTQTADAAGAPSEKIGKLLKLPATQQFYADLYTVRWGLLAVPFVAMTLGGLYMLILRYATGIIVWGSIFLVETVLVGAGFIAFDFQNNPKTYTEKFILLSYLPPEQVRYVSYILWAAATIYTILIVVFWSRISLTVAILKCSTRFISDMFVVVFLPPVSFIITIAYVAYWAISGVYLYTSGTIKPDPNGYPIQEVEWDTFTYYSLWYHLFSGIWGFCFLLALHQFIVGFLTCMWYFTKDKSTASDGALRRALTTAFFYHLGSIAFGSLVLALFSFVRILWEFAQKHLQKVSEQTAVTRGIYRCIDWCLNFCIGFVKFLNQHVYLQIAMTGEGFTDAAKDAFLIMAKNVLRFGFVHTFSSIFVFLGEILIAALTALIGYYYISKIDAIHDAIHNPIVVIVIIGAFGYLVGNNFMKVYGVAADGIVHCFCLDEELKADEGFAPEELKDLLDKREQFKKKEEEKKAAKAEKSGKKEKEKKRKESSSSSSSSDDDKKDKKKKKDKKDD